MNLKLIALLPLPSVQSPQHLKYLLAPIVPSPIPPDLSIEFLPPSSLRISYTQNFANVTDAAQALFTLIVHTWPAWINAARPPP